mgnify:CR=1 FL=1
MANKTGLYGECPRHGEYIKDAEDSPCPGCEDMYMVINPEALHDETVESVVRSMYDDAKFMRQIAEQYVESMTTAEMLEFIGMGDERNEETGLPGGNAVNLGDPTPVEVGTGRASGKQRIGYS